MLKQRRMVAEQIAGALFEAEHAIDAAIAKTATLTGVMPQLRREAGASALIGQDAVERASQAIMALAEARRAIVETHKELSIAQAQIGLGAVTMTDPVGGDKPPLLAHEEQPQVGRRALRALRAA
ncbi:MAG: hypothetical protein ACJ798_07695 [Phenylobacterium sp.]